MFVYGRYHNHKSSGKKFDAFASDVCMVWRVLSPTGGSDIVVRDDRFIALSLILCVEGRVFDGHELLQIVA